MATLFETPIPRDVDLFFDPEYWQDWADELRAQAMTFGAQPRFRAVLERHAQDYDRLAQLALKLKQERNTWRRISPVSRTLSADVTPISAARPPRTATSD